MRGHSRSTHDAEKETLTNFPGDAETPPYPLTACVGHFLEKPRTRTYIQRRFDLANKVMMLLGGPGGRIDALRFCLENFVTILRLCQRDALDLRNIIPALYIRLDRDEEAYSFIKWWTTVARTPDCDWDEFELPHLRVEGADAFEPVFPEWSEGPNPWGADVNLTHAVAVVLIKIKTLLDLQTVQTATGAFESDTLPTHFATIVREQIGSGRILASHPELIRGSSDRVVEAVDTITVQINELYEGINTANPHLWGILFENPQRGSQSPSTSRSESEEDAYSVRRHSLASWIETAKALDVLKACTELDVIPTLDEDILN
ncbi:hypothetical protein TWF481_010094 [Arthrobotrys musiformis]|uniref:Uncharacterized protein n=1 Tax=Arthrobotrys musiformis TaxID=47236 RepID=A0AAV9W5Q3_9PEZI